MIVFRFSEAEDGSKFEEIVYKDKIFYGRAGDYTVLLDFASDLRSGECMALYAIPFELTQQAANTIYGRIMAGEDEWNVVAEVLMLQPSVKRWQKTIYCGSDIVPTRG